MAGSSICLTAGRHVYLCGAGIACAGLLGLAVMLYSKTCMHLKTGSHPDGRTGDSEVLICGPKGTCTRFQTHL